MGYPVFFLLGVDRSILLDLENLALFPTRVIRIRKLFLCFNKSSKSSTQGSADLMPLHFFL